MASKLEQAVTYIESLQIGSKLSIKSLAKELTVSDGTAYHAIKKAEQLGLVVTLPKAGTTRVRKEGNLQEIDLSISKVQSLTGAECLTEKPSDDHVVKEIYVAVDSAAAVHEALKKTGRDSLCITGDRKEIQETAISCGADLLLVNNVQTDREILEKAVEKNCVVLRTKWPASYVTGCLANDAKVLAQSIADMGVRQWMRSPQFLYLDDLVADAIGIFKDYGLRKIPVVDREKNICGFLQIEEAFDADRSQRISRVYEQKTYLQMVDVSATMKEALPFFRNGQAYYLPVVEEGKLVGILYFSDVLEILLQSNRIESGSYQLPFLSVLDEESSENRCIFVLKTESGVQREKNIHSDLKSIMRSAAAEYCKKNGWSGTELASSFSLESVTVPSDEMYVSVETVLQGNETCVISCEAYDDRISYGRYHMTLHK